MRTRHFSHTAVCTQSHKRLRNICMFTCSCTTNHLVLFPSQLLDSQCFSLHMYSICTCFYSVQTAPAKTARTCRVVRLAERISGSALPSLQNIYLKCCKSRAVKIIKDSNHPGNCLFNLLPSGKRFRSLMAKTERLRRSFFPQAIRLLNSNSAS